MEMKQCRSIISFGLRYCCVVSAMLLLPFSLAAQQHVAIFMAAIDGVPITPDNVLNYQVQSSFSGIVQVKGMIRYRNSNMHLSYSFSCSLNEGMNLISTAPVSPRWQFSSSALQELFLNYKVLPQGTFEYCVTITPGSNPKEQNAVVFDECLYQRSNDLFLINLIDPANKAKLKEYNPMLTWIANYSFSNDLTYRIRVAEIKHGQNAVNAVMRNQPVYDEKNLPQNSVVYPVYAKPLLHNQPYAWAVDAYYKGILLGGSEVWEFIIPDDTLPTKYPANRSYIDIRREAGNARYNIMGELKLKYTLDKFRSDILELRLINDNKENIDIKPSKVNAVYGDNRYILNLKDSSNLRHLKDYQLLIRTGKGENYMLPFKYINPDFAR